MNKNTLIALSDFMRTQNLSVSDLEALTAYARFYKGLPLLENGEQLPLELRYADNSVSKTFVALKPILAVHVNSLDIALSEPPCPLPFDAAVKYCQQQGMKMLTSAELPLLLSELKAVNSVLEAVIGQPLRSYFYWLSDKASKPYKAKAINLATGNIKEFNKRDSFYVRPVKF